jgi:hypothetical protein
MNSTEEESFLDNATYQEKAKGVKDIIDGFRKERKDKLKVDRDVEKDKDSKTYAQKSAEFTNIQNFYKREKKREEKEAERLAPPSQRTEKNIFTFVKNISPANDIFAYRRAFNQYSGLSTTRSYVENNRRIIYDRPVVGSYMSFRYFAKNWNTLPKFDRSPLVYVTSVDGDRFTGINFHWAVSNNIAFDLIDEIESGNTNIPFPDDMWHTYLLDQKYLRSPLYTIDASEIRVAVMLPLVQWFQK